MNNDLDFPSLELLLHLDPQVGGICNFIFYDQFYRRAIGKHKWLHCTHKAAENEDTLIGTHMMKAHMCYQIENSYFCWLYENINNVMISMKKKSTMTSNMIGNEFKIVDTKLDILGI
mgnify:CR=1 FL=1